MARRFFFTAMGVLALAAAYHLGAVRTEAQGTGTFVSFWQDRATSSGRAYALSSSGDVWRINVGQIGLDPSYMGNIISGPVAADGQSFGTIKDAFRR